MANAHLFQVGDRVRHAADVDCRHGTVSQLLDSEAPTFVYVQWDGFKTSMSTAVKFLRLVEEAVNGPM